MAEERPAPATETPTPAPAVEEARAALSPAESRGGLDAPAVRDLAAAFRATAETVEGVRQLQSEIVRSLKRQDRTELVVQSTQTLNDTFRNLTAVQRELMDRLEATRRATWGRLVPWMLIGLLVVFLGGLYVVVTALEQVRAERVDPAEIAEQASLGALAAFRSGQLDAEEATQQAHGRLLEQIEQMREREEALRRRIDTEGATSADLLRQVRALEGEREGLARQVLEAQNQVLARRVLETELQEASGRLAVVEPRLEDLERALAAERAENDRLRTRLGIVALGHEDPASTPEPDGASDAAPAAQPAPMPASAPGGVPDPAAASRRVDRDPVLLQKILTRVNELLEQTTRSRPGTWRLARMEGVSPDGLVGVVASRYDRATGRLLEQVTAADVRIWVDRAARTVDLEFRQGTLRDPAGTKPLPDAGLAYRVAEGELYRLWSQSGMLFLRTR